MVEQAERDGNSYDLLLIDWVMPGLDGAGVLAALNARETAVAPLPVIVSAYDSDIVHDTATALGARHFLPKPVLPESLRGLINWLGGVREVAPLPLDASRADTALVGRRVLLVEDNPINQQLAVELLQARGMAVDVAANGKAAIARLNAWPAGHYSVVLMDLQMPVMDGYEATRLIRMDARHVSLPIIAMTAHAMADERQRCLVLGMNGHISKPIAPDLLYETLAEVTGAVAPERPGPTTATSRSKVRADGVLTTQFGQVSGLDVQVGMRHAGGNAAL